MSTKHTPGEWTVKDNGIWDITIEAGGTICHINNRGDWFPKNEGEDGRSHNQMLADARLIAAAPEMLECLKECLRIYEEARNAQPTGHLWPDPNHILHARRAIAAAEGDEQEQDKRAELDPATDPWLTDLLGNR